MAVVNDDDDNDGGMMMMMFFVRNWVAQFREAKMQVSCVSFSKKRLSRQIVQQFLRKLALIKIKMALRQAASQREKKMKRRNET